MRLIGTFSSDVAEFREPLTPVSFGASSDIVSLEEPPVLTGGALSSDVAEFTKHSRFVGRR